VRSMRKLLERHKKIVGIAELLLDVIEGGVMVPAAGIDKSRPIHDSNGGELFTHDDIPEDATWGEKSSKRVVVILPMNGA